MNKTLLALSVSLLLATQGCSDNAKTSEVVNSTPASVDQAVEQTASEKYLAMVDAFNEQLKLEPIYATFVGVNDYNDQFGGSLTEDYLKQRHELNSRYFDQAKSIDVDKLSASLKLSYDMFIYDRNMALVGESYPEHFLPINQFYSTVFTMVQLGTGESAQPFKTVEDYQHWLSRLRGFIKWTELAQQRMDEGIASKVVLPKVLVERIIPQLDAQLVDSAQNSLFYSPITLLPDNFTAEQKADLTQQYTAVINAELLPALNGLRDYIQQVYLPKSRASDGWWGLPNGKDWYQHLANSHTTTTLPVDEIHQIGLSEVARILSEMDKVREQVGFKGDLTEFLHRYHLNRNIFSPISKI